MSKYLKLVNYLKINGILTSPEQYDVLLKCNILVEIIKKCKALKQKMCNRRWRLNNPEKAKEVSKRQAYKLYHNDEEYRLNKIQRQKQSYKNKILMHMEL